jgi:hypothetical protein
VSDFAHFEIEAHANGLSRVVVNGADVSDDVRGYELRGQHGAPPVLVLYHLAASGPIEGDGIVHVVDDGMDQRGAVLAFLDNLDAEELEEQATDGMSMATDDGSTSMGGAFLAALKKAAGAP